MTSFISLRCPCKQPKIIGFALIKEVESIAMAISTVLAYLTFPPRTLWYDNCCNLYDSDLLRTPFLLKSCLMVVDRFHFQGHSCSNQFNPNRYDLLRNQRSVAAEVMKAVIERSAGFIRYLRGENIRTYLRVMFAIHNFISIVKDDLNRSELPVVDFSILYNGRFCYDCAYCSLMMETEEWNRAKVQSISYQPIITVRKASKQKHNAKGSSATLTT